MASLPVKFHRPVEVTQLDDRQVRSWITRTIRRELAASGEIRLTVPTGSRYLIRNATMRYETTVANTIYYQMQHYTSQQGGFGVVEQRELILRNQIIAAAGRAIWAYFNADNGGYSTVTDGIYDFFWYPIHIPILDTDEAFRLYVNFGGGGNERAFLEIQYEEQVLA